MNKLFFILIFLLMFGITKTYSQRIDKQDIAITYGKPVGIRDHNLAFDRVNSKFYNFNRISATWNSFFNFDRVDMADLRLPSINRDTVTTFLSNKNCHG